MEVNILLNYFLIKSYGFMGAAYASILTKIFFTIITYKVSQRLFPIPYRINSIMLLIFIGSVFCFIPYFVQNHLEDYNIFFVVLMKCLLLLVFGSLLVFKNISSIRILLKKRND